MKEAQKAGVFRANAQHYHYAEQELTEWEQGLDDDALVKRARKMDILLSDFLTPPQEDDRDNGHWRIGTFGDMLLQYPTQQALRQAVREKKPAYRKEKRETLTLIAQWLFGISGFVVAALAIIFK